MGWLGFGGDDKEKDKNKKEKQSDKTKKASSTKKVGSIIKPITSSAKKVTSAKKVGSIIKPITSNTKKATSAKKTNKIIKPISTGSKKLTVNKANEKRTLAVKKTIKSAKRTSPAAVMQRSNKKSVVNNNQKISLKIKANPGQNEEEIAKRVVRKIEEIQNSNRLGAFSDYNPVMA